MRPRSAPRGEIETFLNQLPLCARMQNSGTGTIAAASRFYQLETGERLFWESDPSDACYIVRTGRISLVLNAPDGRELVIEDIRPGDIVGEVGLLASRPHNFGAMARARTEVLAIPRRAFLRALEDEPRFARQLLEVAARRLQRSATREMALAFFDAQARLARCLLAMEAQERENGYVTASQEDLARNTGLIRQTVARALGIWRRQGWLLTGRGRIVILNRKALEEIQRGQIV